MRRQAMSRHRSNKMYRRGIEKIHPRNDMMGLGTRGSIRF